MSQPQPAPPAPPPKDAARQPIRVEPVPGTGYGLAIYGAPPATSGPGVGSLVAGIASVLVAMVVGCVGLAAVATSVEGGPAGWGVLVGGAFAMLASFFAILGVGLGVVGLRQTRPGRRPHGDQVGGRGMAVAGLICGATGGVIAVCSLGLAGVAAVGG